MINKGTKTSLWCWRKNILPHYVLWFLGCKSWRLLFRLSGNSPICDPSMIVNWKDYVTETYKRFCNVLADQKQSGPGTRIFLICTHRPRFWGPSIHDNFERGGESITWIGKMMGLIGLASNFQRLKVTIQSQVELFSLVVSESWLTDGIKLYPGA